MTFWSPVRDHDHPNRFHLQARPEACVGPPDRQFFMGGVALAATIAALEETHQKPLLWATIQFLSHGMLGDEITVTLDPSSGGKSITQCAATVTAGDRVLQKVMASLGARDDAFDVQFAQMPDVLPPQQCPEKPADSFAQPGNLLDQVERRIAAQDDALGLE